MRIIQSIILFRFLENPIKRSDRREGELFGLIFFEKRNFSGDICKPNIGLFFAADIVCANISAVGYLYKKTVYRFCGEAKRYHLLKVVLTCAAPFWDAAENEKEGEYGNLEIILFNTDL